MARAKPEQLMYMCNICHYLQIQDKLSQYVSFNRCLGLRVTFTVSGLSHKEKQCIPKMTIRISQL